MKSNLRESEEKIEKATELLWKFFWFCFYLLIMPFLISLIAFYLFQLFIMKIYIVLGFTVIIFMFSLLFFYKVFDKYRKKPFFQNNINNLTARINIIFLITISSLIITPIFTFISTEDYSFELLTIISFILLYNIVWFYYYYQPIDLYSSLDGKFKHKIGFKTSISRIHNLVVIINYIIHIIFLFIIFYVGNSWIYLLITNIFFYLIGIVFTKRLRSKIKNAIKEKKDFSLELIKFQRKFVTFIDTLIFCVLIQIPVIILMVPFPGIEYTTLIFSSFVCISIIFIIFYFKTMIYILVHYKSKSKFSSLVSTPKIEENKSEEKITYHWFNSLLSAILIIVIVLFTFLIGMLYLILIILPFIYILSYYELKSGLNTKKSIGWIHLINSIAILAVIAFGILPSISEIFFMNLQLIIFLLSMYFVLEIFLVLKYFTKPVIRLFQNFLAVTSFFLIAYSIYPPMIIEYIIFAFLIVLLISFYRFYPLFFRKRSLKTFKVLIFLNFFAIILYLFFLINIKAFFLLEFNIFLNILVLTILLIPGILLLFLFVNYLINILSVREYLNSTYYTCWILIVTIFLSILMIFYTIIIVIILDLMLISFLIHYQLRFGQKLKKIKETRFKHLNKVNSYFFTVALSCFYFFVFSLWFNIILSIFISLLLISVQISILAKKGVFFSKPLSVKMNIITLLYFSFITFYYILLLTLNTIYVLIVPLISFTIVFYLPLLYLLNKKINPKLIRKALILNTLILSILLLSFPTIIYIELSRLGLFRNITYFIWIFIIMTAINSTLAIFSLILLFTYGILKSQELKKDYGTKILKILIFLIVIFIFSVVFYYPFFYLYGTFYSILIPIILTSFSLYFPMVYSYRKGLFNSKVIRKIIIIDSIVLSCSIMLIPTIIGLELVRLGISVDVIIIILSTFVLLFGFLKFLDFNAKRIHLKDIYSINLKFIQIFVWFSITFLILLEFILIIFFVFFNIFTLFIISLSFLIFFFLNLYNIKQINNLKEFLSENKDLMLNYLKIYTVFEYYRNIIFFGIISSLSLFLTFLIPVYNLLILLPAELLLLGIFWFLGFFFSFILILLILSELILKTKFSMYTAHFKLISWLYLKICISLTLAIYTYPFSIFNKINLFFLIFSLLTPISYYFSSKTKIKIKNYEFLLKRIFLYIFTVSILIFYIELAFLFISSVPFFYDNFLIMVSVIILNLYILSNFSILRSRDNLKSKSILSIYSYYGLVGILFFSLLYFNPNISLVLLLLIYPIVLYYRNTNLILRFILYFIISFITFIEIFALFETYGILYVYRVIPIGFYIIIYLISIFSVLLTSIMLNLSKNNYLEKYLLFSIISLLSFVYLLTYTNILIIYNVTISLFIFSLLMGLNLYYLKDKRYKWFIKPCILLFVFDFISWISYSFLFINPIYYLINPTLIFTLTLSITSFSFVILFNKSPETFRNKSFSIVLSSLIVCFPIFFYFYLMSYFPISLNPIIASIIALNLGIFLFYFSIGIYQWKLSWAIWKTGWWAWNLLPIVNFIIIYNTVSGINVLTNAINILGDIDILFISIIFCILLWLPALYELVKDHFIQVLFFVWGCSLFLVYYVSLNLFIGNIPLTNTFFIIFSTISIMPLIYKMKYWKILSLLWLVLGVVNVLFFWFFLHSIGITNSAIIISLLILISGLFFHMYSFFPNIRKHRFSLLVFSYSIMLFGIFLTIYSILFSIIFNVFISINITFIIIASTLFTSKYTKINRKFINYFASWILIVNLSLLTFNTFSLIPGMELFGLFLSITVFGGSFFLFNHYKIIGPINKGIPWMIMGFGLASSISSLFLIFLQVNILLICAIYSSIIILFLYFALDEYKYILLYLIPIPTAFLMVNLLYDIEIIQNIAILTWIMFYFIFFQILFNSFNSFIKESKILKKPHLKKFFEGESKIKLLNLFCFTIISTCFSLLISIIVNVSILHKILLFFLIWPIFMLFCLKYIKSSNLDRIYPKISKYLSIKTTILYFLIPISIVVNFFLPIIDSEIELIILIPLLFMIFNGILFIETFVLDRKIFKFLVKNINKYLVLLSWGFFCNNACFFFYLFHINVYLFILTLVISNIITNYFLKQIDIKRTERYSKARIFLIYIALITLAFYVSSAISDSIASFYIELVGTPYTLTFLLISFSMLFVFSYFFNRKIKIRIKNFIEFLLFLSVQGLLLAVYWIVMFVIFNAINIFTIFLIILIETCLTYVSINYFDRIIFKEKISEFLTRAYSIITLLLYLEVSFLFFGLFIDIIGFFGSFLISQIILFLFTISDIHVIKKLSKGLAYFIHTISYFLISALLFVILLQLFTLEFISFYLFLLISTQFYTNYAFFTFLKKLNPNKAETYGKIEIKIKNLIGIIFYVFLVFFMQNTIVLMPWEFQLLLLSITVHLLMIIDRSILKFLGKSSDYIKFLSWVSIMIFSSIYLYWIFNFYFYIILIAVIPLIIVILVLELGYLIKLLDFIQIIKNNKEKIKKVLIFILYINFITWSLYFAILDVLIILNLLLLSIIITWILTFIDGYFNVIREKIRLKFRKISFLLIGLLVSANVFILLTPSLVFLLNFSIVSLIFLIFAAFVIKPFKKHSALALTYWNICFLFLSIIVYYIFMSLQISLFFFLITFVIYWFIFALERLREIFSKFIKFLAKFFGKIKQALIIAMNKIINFFKTYFKYIWLLVSLLIAIAFAYLVSPYLGLLHLIFLSLAIFGLSYSIVPSEKIDDPGKIFRRKMKRLIIVWGSVIGIIFIFIPLEFLTLMIFVAILILGAILLPYIYYKEKKELISIKWRFYSTIFFIIILIITGILMYLQFSGFLIIG